MPTEFWPCWLRKGGYASREGLGPIRSGLPSHTPTGLRLIAARSFPYVPLGDFHRQSWAVAQSSASSQIGALLEAAMADKINRRALESYFTCKFKAHLTLSGAPGVESDYLEMVRDQSLRLKSAIEQKLTGDQAIPERAILTRHLLSTGAPLIINGLFEDDYFTLEFDGLARMNGASEIGPFHYAPIIFYDGHTIHLLQKQLLETYAAILHLLQARKPTVGIVYDRDHAERTMKLSSDAATASHVLRHLKDIQDGAIPPLRLNDHCSICEYRQQCHAQAVKEDNLSLLRGISETEITHLRSKGLFTVTQLSYTFKSRRTPKRAKVPSERHHFALQALAIREKKVFIHGSPLLDRVYISTLKVCHMTTPII
jgi:predicted RecB family nuclease